MPHASDRIDDADVVPHGRRPNFCDFRMLIPVRRSGFMPMDRFENPIAAQ
jgi:hypothetical protein